MELKDCNHDYRIGGQYIMLLDDLWNSLGIHTESMLCRNCIESILGRKIVPSDLKYDEDGDIIFINIEFLAYWLASNKDHPEYAEYYALFDKNKVAYNEIALCNDHPILQDYSNAFNAYSEVLVPHLVDGHLKDNILLDYDHYLNNDKVRLVDFSIVSKLYDFKICRCLI